MLPDLDTTMMVIEMAQLFYYGSSLIQASTEEYVILSVRYTKREYYGLTLDGWGEHKGWKLSC